MKRKLILLVMLLLTAMIISGCDVTGIIPPISENPELTPEEIALINKWGYGGDYVVRWPNGYVDVYDATGYSQMQKVLDQWNVVIGGPVVFRLSSNPNSPVRIIFNPDMPHCGYEDVQWGDDDVFSEVIIEISPDEYTCETYNINTKYCLYLHMFNAVVGFNIWAEVDPTPFEDWSNFNTIPNTIKTMVHALYKVPPGYCLIEEQEIEFEPFNCQTYPDQCYGCLPGVASEFGGFNWIDYDGSPKVTLTPKVGTLPKNIRITLEGVKFDIEKDISFSGNTCSTQPDFVTGDWSSSSSTIAEATFINGVLTNKKYDDINGYVIETDFLSSQIYIKLSEDRGYAFKAVPWKGIEMKVYDLSGKEIGSYSFSKGIFPKVESNFGQCVWWAIRQKWETDGIKITSPFYPPPGGLEINKNYSPVKNDVLVAYYNNVEHYAFILEEPEGEIVTISQFNYPKQERKSEQKLRWKNGIWSVPDIGNCTYWCQFNYYIR